MAFRGEMAVTLLGVAFALAACAGQPPAQESTAQESTAEDRTAYGSRYADVIRSQIGDKIRYPSELSKARKEGTVVVLFVIDRSGGLVDVTVYRTTEPGFNTAALAAVRAAAPFPPIPPELKAQRLRLAQPVDFRLQHPPVLPPADNVVPGDR